MWREKVLEVKTRIFVFPRFCELTSRKYLPTVNKNVSRNISSQNKISALLKREKIVETAFQFYFVLFLIHDFTTPKEDSQLRLV